MPSFSHNDDHYNGNDVESPRTALVDAQHLHSSQETQMNTGTFLDQTLECTFLEIMLQSRKLRWATYALGMATPQLHRDMEWYQILAFTWAWIIRLCFLIFFIMSIVFFILQLIYLDKHAEIPLLYVLVEVFFNLQMIILVPILYDLCFKKRRYWKVKFHSETAFTDISKCLKEVGGICVVHITLLIIAFATLNKCNCFLDNVSIAQFWPMFSFQVFVYLTFSVELAHIQTVYCQTILPKASSASLTGAEYRALHKFMAAKSESHVFSLSIFTLITLFGCIMFLSLLLGYLYLDYQIPWFWYLLGMYFYAGKDVYFLFSIIWKIAAINSRSQELTVIASDNPPSTDNTIVFMGQVARPLVYKIFGALTLYQVDLVVSLLGYIVSLVVAVTKSALPAK